jgi:hypothetical protein
MRISQASYSAPLWPSASSSSSITVTFTPLGVASEYSCSGCRPTGRSLSCVGPAIGRLMLANRPPLPLFQVQTAGGEYAVVSVMAEAPAVTGALALRLNGYRSRSSAVTRLLNQLGTTAE